MTDMKFRSYKTRVGVLAVTWVATGAVASVFYVAILAPARHHCAQVGQALVEANRRREWVNEATRTDCLKQLDEEATALKNRAGNFLYTPDGLAQLALSIGRLAAD